MAKQNKIGVDYIEIERAEGDPKDTGKKQRFSSVKEADKRLREISRTAPRDGSYDKTDVKVVWKDGNVYTGRWDVKHPSQPNPDTSIRKHIEDELKFIAGNSEIIKELRKQGIYDMEDKKVARYMLDNYKMFD